jgi:CheY-like chemotaxis protein
MRKRSPTRVLVIDDDEMSRELLDVLLSGEGYAVATAESGEAALNQLSQARAVPDLVLTDMQLPGISGPELAASLRHACGRSTVLSAMSGSQPAADKISLFDSFLLKPFTMLDVARVLSSGRAAGFSPALPAQAASNNGMVGASALEEVVTPYGGPDLPILDEEIFQKLASRMLPAQLREMYKLCTDDARSRIAAMRRLMNKPNGDDFAREAHAIKGGAGMLGATELHRLAAELETGRPLRRPQDVNSLDELSAACDRLERMLGSRL